MSENLQEAITWADLKSDSGASRGGPRECDSCFALSLCGVDDVSLAQAPREGEKQGGFEEN